MGCDLIAVQLCVEDEGGTWGKVEDMTRGPERICDEQ